LFPTENPSGQTHATDLDGRLSITTHFWPALQGLLTEHGFWQVFPMHASKDGQSASVKHSGFSATTAVMGEKEGKIIEKPDIFSVTKIQRFREPEKKIFLRS
jgi:hypothetical protein